MSGSYHDSQAEEAARTIIQGTLPMIFKVVEHLTGKDLSHVQDDFAKELTTSLTWSLKGFENATIGRAALALLDLDTEVAEEHAEHLRGLLNDMSGFEQWLKDEEVVCQP